MTRKVPFPRNGYTATEYIATLVMSGCIALPVVVGSATPWLLTVVAFIVVLSTWLRVDRIREIRARERRELEGPG